MHRVIVRCSFLALCAAAALAPLISRPTALVTPHSFSGWPDEFENRPLHPLPLADVDTQFSAGFPGKIARFSDGQRELILRWVTAGTRKLHSSADCFRGLGYAVAPAPAWLDSQGARWSCFTARRGPHRLEVRERITSNDGQSRTDVSAWFWSAILHRTRGPWMAITVVEMDSE
ncbi:MAG: hypothetical protein ACR2OZ_03875 [Verrucomicrobiales bacterium]